MYYHPKSLLITALVVIGLTTLYLFYVKQYRQESITRYLPQPIPGDVYKLEHRLEGKHWVYYLKVKEVIGESVFFYPGRGSYNIASDVLMNHYDSSDVMHLDKQQLRDIAAGRWNNDDHDYTTLLEIARK